jgi:GrpB-like predicted nucleotidyltransferase (UPF0157 family)
MYTFPIYLVTDDKSRNYQIAKMLEESVQHLDDQDVIKILNGLVIDALRCKPLLKEDVTEMDTWRIREKVKNIFSHNVDHLDAMSIHAMVKNKLSEEHRMLFDDFLRRLFDDDDDDFSTVKHECFGLSQKMRDYYRVIQSV